MHTIGWLAKQTGVKAPTIRFYEQEGLLSPAPRTQSNRRTYDANDVARLSFIRHARDLGFEMADIRALLTLRDQPAAPCQKADSIARSHLDAIDRRLMQLQALKTELTQMLEACGQGQVCDCRVMEVIADHHLCRHHH